MLGVAVQPVSGPQNNQHEQPNRQDVKDPLETVNDAADKIGDTVKEAFKPASQSTNLSIQLETGNCGMLFILCHLISWNGAQNGTSNDDS